MGGNLRGNRRRIGGLPQEKIADRISAEREAPPIFFARMPPIRAVEDSSAASLARLRCEFWHIVASMPAASSANRAIGIQNGHVEASVSLAAIMRQKRRKGHARRLRVLRRVFALGDKLRLVRFGEKQNVARQLEKLLEKFVGLQLCMVLEKVARPEHGAGRRKQESAF